LCSWVDPRWSRLQISIPTRLLQVGLVPVLAGVRAALVSLASLVGRSAGIPAPGVLGGGALRGTGAAHLGLTGIAAASATGIQVSFLIRGCRSVAVRAPLTRGLAFD
jgi:hypothetical protein